MTIQLTLLIPGLAGPRAAGPALTAGLSLTALETLLSRADRRPGGRGSTAELLFAAFARCDGGDPPVASVSAAADLDADPGGWWLRADPVHLRADRDTLVLAGGESVTLTDDEAARLAAELEPVFAPLGWRLHVGHPRRWYLRLSHDPGVRTHDPDALVGEDIRPFLPHGAQRAAWHRLMNEVQMQLHDSPVNRERAARSVPAVNSLWFWGGGTAPRVRARWDHLWCDHVVGRGLARITATAAHPCPDGAAAWLDEAVPGGHLIVHEDLDRAGRPVDPERWRAAAQRFNEQWAAPLLTALQRGRLDRLALMTDTGVDFEVTPAGARRWWRRRGALERLLSAAG